MFVSAIIAAGGRGHRYGGTLPKQLLRVGGRAVLERSVDLFLSHPEIQEVVVALPAELVADPPPYLRAAKKPLRLVAGGARRQDSVQNAFEAVDAAAELIVIHDAARPFATANLVTRTIAAAAESGAALAALQARDTIKRANGSQPPLVRETLPRETIYLAQTPQVFARRVLRDALALAGQGAEATDEASLAERAGHPVRLVDGEQTNVKITTPEDLSMMEAVASGQDKPLQRPARTGRAGTGYDLHRLVPGRPLTLGGLLIPFELGALGHSDADVVCHSVTDAILGALALGDIGSHFPDTDSRWKDASSIDLLKKVVRLAGDHGYEVGNVDVTIILERPKLRGYVDAMRRSLADALGVTAEQVSIKGKTNEGVDAVGRGEAVAAHAVALVRRL
jgi:2-C-methyl-D-erythritol 4-phosphate cytidylyltransferase/2-C-methyl-D-erythritol 2,4-cyclodiphosphate synthase